MNAPKRTVQCKHPNRTVPYKHTHRTVPCKHLKEPFKCKHPNGTVHVKVLTMCGKYKIYIIFYIFYHSSFFCTFHQLLITIFL